MGSWAEQVLGGLAHHAKALCLYAAALGRSHISLGKIQFILKKYLPGSLETRLGRMELERHKIVSQR